MTDLGIPSYIIPSIPDSVWIVSLLAPGGLIALVHFLGVKGIHTRVLMRWILIADYYFLVLCSTVVFRRISPEFRYNLTPFWSYVAIANGKENLLWENIMNCLLFFPIGLFLIRLKRNSTQWLKVFLIGFSLSVIIELLQLAMRRGFCEFDDIFHNTVGCLMGYGVSSFVLKGIKAFRSHKSIACFQDKQDNKE